MKTLLQHRLRFWIAASLIAMLGWVLIPLTPLDRSAFEEIVQSGREAPVEIQGQGSHRNPWFIQSEPKEAEPSSPSPVVIALEDDLGGLFQESPHSPVDIAVILKNLKRLGIRRLASTVVLAWDDPDPISLTALDRTIEGFDSCILSAPISRGSTSESLPSAFREASIPIDQVKGGTTLLPVANRIPIPGIILNPNTLAGFCSIDSEPPSNTPYLLARWDDRLVFSITVLAIMQQLDLSPEDLVVDVNAFIRFGQSGIELPIDEFGRLNREMDYLTPETFPAAATIDTETTAFPEQFSTAVLADYRTNTSPESQRFNRLSPAIVIELLTSEPIVTRTVYRRLHPTLELLMLLTLAAALFGISHLHKALQLLALTAVTAGCIIIPYWFTNHQQLWLPGIAALITTIPAWLIALMVKPASAESSHPDRIDFVRYAGKPKTGE